MGADRRARRRVGPALLTRHGNRRPGAVLSHPLASTSWWVASNLDQVHNAAINLSDRSTTVRIRRAVRADAPAVTAVWLRSFASALPDVHLAHTDDQVLRWMSEAVLPKETTWVITVSGSIVGMMVLQGTELEQLYIAPEWQGHGLGRRLIALAKQLSPAGLALWTFQVNTSARAFYRRQGFVEAQRTDGHRNDEREPDVQYRWPGAAPLPTEQG